MTNQPKLKHRRRNITAKVIADYNAAEITEGSGTAAVRLIDPTAQDPSRRAQLIRLKQRELDAGEFIDMKMQQIGVEAIERIEQVVQSTDEKTALKAAIFITDHVRGKALQRSETKHLNLNIEAVLG